MLLRAGRAEAGDTLAPTVTLPQTVKGQRNEGDPEPYHERISKVSVMQRSGGDYLNNFHCVFFFFLPNILISTFFLNLNFL